MSDRTESLRRIQEIEQSMQQLLQQKHSFSTQKNEVEQALSEVKKSETSYKIVANIMVKSDGKKLQEELEEGLELLDLRIKSIEKQETRLKEEVSHLQKSAMQKG